MTPALAYDGVSRRFGQTVALDGLTLHLPPGEVLGLIGRNGAGKTTALRLAHGFLHPDRGEVRVLGLDPVTQGLEVRSRASLLSEETALYPWMTVEEILDFGANLHPRWDASLARTLRERLELDPSRRVGALSRGTRAKVALLLAVAPRPELLLLDDPTSGLDPLVRREVLEALLSAVPEEGGAVVYASHLVQDVERVADRVAVLDGSRLVLHGSLDEVKRRIVRVAAVFEDDAPSDLALAGSIEVRARGRVLTVVAEGEETEIAARLRAAGAREVTLQPLPLEDILVALLRRNRVSTPGPAAPVEATREEVAHG